MEDNIENGSNSEDPIEINDEGFVEGQNDDSIEINNEDFSEGKNENSVIISNEDNQVNVPTKRIEIYNRSELNELNLKVTELVICSNTCNELNVFCLNKFKWLESLEIGDNCFEHVHTFKIYGLNHLKTVTIGKKSFTQKKDRSGNDKSKSFHIRNCPLIESIVIGEYSFSDYAGEFELKNLPQLQFIKIGVCDEESFNFFSCSFVIRGTFLDMNV